MKTKFPRHPTQASKIKKTPALNLKSEVMIKMATTTKKKATKNAAST